MTSTDNHSDSEDDLGALDTLSLQQSEFEKAQRYALLRQIQSEKGQKEFVDSVVTQTILSNNCDWGKLLSSAPRALSQMGQCFVVASSPFAASLRLPDGHGLVAKSLRANLVHCSDLGRSSFREAESKMGKVSMVAQAICEPNGTVEKILRAVEDDDLAEFEVPRQLNRLRKISQDCVTDTKAVKTKVLLWKEYIEKIRLAVEDENHTTRDNERRLESEIVVKENSKTMKEEEKNASIAQTAEYKQRLKARQAEYNTSMKSLNRGTWTDLAVKSADTLLSTASSFLSPTLGFSLSWGSSKDTNSEAPATMVMPEYNLDQGYKLADRVSSVLRHFGILMSTGSDPAYYGMDWNALCGASGNQKNSIQVLVGTLQDRMRPFQSPTPVTRSVQDVVDPVLQIGGTLINLVHQQSTLGSRTDNIITEKNVMGWQQQMKSAEKKILDIMEEGKHIVLDKEKKRKQKAMNNTKRSSNMSKAELRFQRFQQAQAALFQAEELLTKRMEAERKANEESEQINLDLRRLSEEVVTNAKVADILLRCINNLQQFTEQLDDLNQFFTQVHQFIEHIHESRVEELIGSAETARKVLDKSSDAEAKQRKKKMVMNSLKCDALQLRGYYLVAQSMAQTYVDISSKYIIPGVNKMDRLSISSDHEVGENEMQKKIKVVEQYSKLAQEQISKMANERKEALLSELIQDRGEASEVFEIEYDGDDMVEV